MSFLHSSLAEILADTVWNNIEVYHWAMLGFFLQVCYRICINKLRLINFLLI